MNDTLLSAIETLNNKKTAPFCAYIYDLDGIQAHVRQMRQTLPKQTYLFYAIKANPDQRIIKALLPFIHGFEVASIGELLSVRAMSKQVPILFGGPGKKDAELELAIRQKVSYIHVESLLELQRIQILAQKLNEKVNILLRINLRTNALPKTKITMGGIPSPFGLDESDIHRAIAIVKEDPHHLVQIKGFHFHSLSNNVHAAIHAEMVQLYVQKALEWQRLYNLELRILNAGGGFGVSYNEAPSFDWQQFSSLLQASNIWQDIKGIQLFFEPGRYLVADYGFYATEIIDIKKSHQQYFAVVRGGTHHNRLPSSWGHNQPFQLYTSDTWPYTFQRPNFQNIKVNIVGELCTPKDRLHTDAYVSAISVGDIIIFEKSGAYCWTISHHDFLGHPHPAFYYIEGGQVR
jgi:diaminopimelate decarboxylase